MFLTVLVFTGLAMPPTPTPIIEEQIVYEDVAPQFIESLKTVYPKLKAEQEAFTAQLARLQQELQAVIAQKEELEAQIKDLDKMTHTYELNPGQPLTVADLQRKFDDFFTKFTISRKISLWQEDSQTFTAPMPYFVHRIVFKEPQSNVRLTFSARGRVTRREVVRGSEVVFSPPVFFKTLIVETEGGRPCPTFELFEAPRLTIDEN